MPFQRSRLTVGALAASALLGTPAFAADIIVSAQDGKFVRVEGRATFPQPAPPDSLVVIDASQSPPVVKGTLEGIEHTVQGPPQAVAVTPDGKRAASAGAGPEKAQTGPYLRISSARNAGWPMRTLTCRTAWPPLITWAWTMATGARAVGPAAASTADANWSQAMRRMLFCE